MRISSGVCGKNCRELFPDATFSFLPADIVTQILNFGLPAPIDVQVVGNDFEGNRILANKLLKRISQVTGVADARIQQPGDAPTIKVDVNRISGEPARRQRKGHRAPRCRSPGRLDPDQSDLLAQSAEWRLLSGGDADAAILDAVARRSGAHSRLAGQVAADFSARSRDISRTSSDAVVSHYSVQPVIDIFATNSGRDLGAVSADIQRGHRRIDNASGRAAPRSSCAARPRP